MGRLVYSQWKAICAERGMAPAVSVPASDLNHHSFKDLQGMVSLMVDELSSLLNPANRIVAFQYPNSAEWLGVFLACQALDAIALPIDPDVPREAVDGILESLKASAFVDGRGTTVMEKGTLHQPACLIKLTSGSTGAPRPLFFEDQKMLADGNNILCTMGITAKDSNLATIPLGHSYGLGNLVMPCIMAGCAIKVCKDPFPHALAESVAKGQPTVYPTVPAILRTLTRSDVSAADFSSIRLWISAGSFLDPKVARSFNEKFTRQVHNFYGSSETGGIAYDRSGESTGAGSSVGKPLENVRVSISPSGRLVVASNAVYSRNNRMQKNGLGRCLLPDLAAILADGSIQLKGRTARIAKLGGKRLSLAEVEKSLNDLAGVDDCHVDVYRDSSGRTRLAAVVVSSQSTDNLQRCLKKRLPSWKIPTRWISLESMPVNARGKRDQAAIKDLIRNSRRGPEKP